MRFVLVVGTSETATIDGISAAGADPDLMVHTPAADVEIVEYGRPVLAPVTPVSPSGCPTPAVITRAVRELVDFDLLTVESGQPSRTATPAVTVGDGPGADIRSAEAVPAAESIFERARQLGRRLPDDEVFVGESIPGGTTTALGVLSALGESYEVSSSLPENPMDLKRDVVAAGLTASDLAPGEAASDPIRAIRRMGDPVQPAVAGLAIGSLESDTEVTLAGGTQMVAAAAVIRHFGIESRMHLATTSFVDESTPDLRRAVDDLDVDLTVTDPEFDRSDHVALERYALGEAKEGVGMGGALALASREGISNRDIRDQIERTYAEVLK